MRNSSASLRQLCSAAFLLAIGFAAPGSAEWALAEISASGASCARTTEGGAVCWGANSDGMVGDGTTSHRTQPVEVSGLGPGSITAISTGAWHACAVTSGGAAVCWGWNPDGQLGNGTVDTSLVPTPVSGLQSGVVAIAAGLHHSCALSDAGAVHCWGEGSSYQLGNGATDSSLTPVPVSGLGSGVSAITVGEYHSCALLDDGSLRCWGDNSWGQLGDGSNELRPTPVAVAGLPGPVASIDTGSIHTCAVTDTGAAFCWGHNAYGQLGDGTQSDRNLPTPVSGLGSGALSISAGLDHSCAIGAGGAAHCWGRNKWGELGDGTLELRTSPVAVVGLDSDVVSMSASYGFSCAVRANGLAHCWGYEVQGWLGTGKAVSRSQAREVSGLESGAVDVATGYRHSCAITSDGSALCWGGNASGQLGDGTLGERTLPTPVSNAPADLAAVAVGFEHSCARDDAGALYCWGKNETGQLGDGSLSDRHEPVAVSGLGSGVGSFAAGERHSCAVVSGAAKCWGDNTWGQLGDGTTDSSSTPVAVLGLPSPVTAVTAGFSHSCAVADGGAWCWGERLLENGETELNLSPVAVSGLTSGVAGIAAASNHTCAWTATGDAHCWGWNDVGQLGDGSNTDRSSPGPVTGLAGLTAGIEVGQSRSCARLVDGSARCWGENFQGSLGNRSNEDSNLPVEVVDLAGSVSIDTSGGHSCAVGTGGTVLCWGANHNGQLGDGFSLTNPLPQSVLPEPSAILALLAGALLLAALPRR